MPVDVPELVKLDSQQEVFEHFQAAITAGYDAVEDASILERVASHLGEAIESAVEQLDEASCILTLKEIQSAAVSGKDESARLIDKPGFRSGPLTNISQTRLHMQSTCIMLIAKAVGFRLTQLRQERVTAGKFLMRDPAVRAAIIQAAPEALT